MVESAPTAQSQQLLQALDLDQELTLCKQYLEESQEEVQQLQAQLAGSRQAASAAASKATKLQQQLHDSQQQLHDSQRLNEQLQQELASKAEAAELQLAAARQQLTDAKQALIAMQAAMRDLQLHQQQQAQHGQAQADQAADKLALVKGQATAAKAELKRVQAAAEQQVAVLAAELSALQVSEAAARAEASKTRSAHASCCCQLAEAQGELLQCREQLQALSGLRSELSFLQAALTQHKQQQQHKHHQQQQEASAGGADRQEELQQELSSCKVMLAEAQQEVAQLEADSRQLEAIRRSSTPNAMASRIPLPAAAAAARPATAAGDYASASKAGRSGATCSAAGRMQQSQQWPPAAACARARCSSSTGSIRSSSGSSASGSSPGRSGIPRGPAVPEPSSSHKGAAAAAGLAAAAQPPLHAAAIGPFPSTVPPRSCPGSARGSLDLPGAGAAVVTPRRASASAAGRVQARDLAALRRMSATAASSPFKQQAVADAGSTAGTARRAAAALPASPAIKRDTWAATGTAIPLSQVLLSPRLPAGLEGADRQSPRATTDAKAAHRVSAPGAT